MQEDFLGLTSSVPSWEESTTALHNGGESPCAQRHITEIFQYCARRNPMRAPSVPLLLVKLPNQEYDGFDSFN